MKISLSEASETDYWLEIIEEMKWINKSEIKSIRSEAK
ncbi:MAG: four helix bundle protein [Flavobacteriaceae bacterium]|nr:four helix bundle protein [Flavobacteriaceae bacterium]